ncbi:uncharacterized protein L3040_003293 [Drepanopeziza brunnea f. sp. 'multigermtubi']|uniref:uncharacterized protein n=1 Tax=Drepanopeziza brunnea f. sp. 'multigermtubi' TaxID=698441 RepID=UPI0023915FC2|nr:hypothetical protein L3040_003293 [Drepanopeziza brunnea f. sp. 'multigermtubi']
MVSIKSLLTVLFISAVSATRQTCVCGEPSETKAVCDLFAQADAQWNGGTQECFVVNGDVGTSYRIKCPNDGEEVFLGGRASIVLGYAEGTCEGNLGSRGHAQQQSWYPLTVQIVLLYFFEGILYMA